MRRKIKYDSSLRKPSSINDPQVRWDGDPAGFFRFYAQKHPACRKWQAGVAIRYQTVKHTIRITEASGAPLLALAFAGDAEALRFDQTTGVPPILGDFYAGMLQVCRNGTGVEFDEDVAKKVLLEKEINILVELNSGSESASAWGCDLTYYYVKINGDYRT